jgi:hypothetical protein
VAATHYDHVGQTACWPGRALNFSTKHHEVTCGSCRRTKVYRDALAEVVPAQVWPRNGRTSVRRRIAPKLAGAGFEPDPRDTQVISSLIERLSA